MGDLEEFEKERTKLGIKKRRRVGLERERESEGGGRAPSQFEVVLVVRRILDQEVVGE